MNVKAPEDFELEKKRKVLERLKDRLADAEENLADLSGELDQFEAQYKMQVSRFYAELDEIEAEIAEEELKLVPDDEEIKKKVEELRRRAVESAAEAETDETSTLIQKPTAEAKKAYHNIARIIHPDLALDAMEKARRHVLMSQLNAAYSAGDQARLDKLVEDFRDSPDLISGDSVGDNLVRVIRQIYQIKKRFVEIKEEILAAEQTELYTLREKSRTEMLEGRDMLAQMSAKTKSYILKSRRRLMNLRNLNVAQEDYVKDQFGLDITEFREK
jgi:hypothetical protein